MGLKDQILSATDCQREKVIVAEWNNATLYVRNITAGELDSWQAETYTLNDKFKVEVNKDNIRCRLLVRCIVDEQGNRVFEDEDAELLGTKNTQIIDKLFKIAERLNAVGPKDVEELAKN